MSSAASVQSSFKLLATERALPSSLLYKLCTLLTANWHLMWHTIVHEGHLSWPNPVFNALH